MRRISSERFLFMAIVVVFVVYGAFFIAQTSFMLGEERFFSLFDDAMVSMTYARNLANGDGLVWFPGEAPVEGYTNTLWVLYMALLHLLPVAESKISLLVQITSLGLLTANLFLVRRIAGIVAKGSAPVALVSVVFTAFHYPLVNWALQGMEVGAAAFIVSLSLLGILETFEDGRFRPWPYIVLGAGVFLRPDMTVPFGAIGGFAALADPVNRKRHLAYAGGILVGCVAFITLFRLWYFNDIYPNTYYLKMTGFPALLRISKGLITYLRWVGATGVVFFLGALLAPLFPEMRNRKALLLLVTFAAVSAYSVYVGGDHWEKAIVTNRYISIVMPAFFVLLAAFLMLAVSSGVDFAAQGLARGYRPTLLPLLLLWAIPIVIGRSTYVDGQLTLQRAPIHVNDNRSMVVQARRFRRLSRPDATAAVVWAGAAPYFSHRKCFDLLGKCDTVIAREPVPFEGDDRSYYLEQAQRNYGRTVFGVLDPVCYAFKPGNMKYDLRHSVDSLRPDVVMQVRPFWNPTEALSRDYDLVCIAGSHSWFVRRESNLMRWDLIRDTARPGSGTSGPYSPAVSRCAGR